MVMNRRTLVDAILRARRRHQVELGHDAIDEMAIPSYLEGNALSRFFSWGKLHFVLKAAELKANQRILDFGCGTGILLGDFTQDGRFTFATDLELTVAREVTRELGISPVQFIQPDEVSNEIPDGSLDRIVAANVLEHVEERVELLKLFGRKLKVDGRLIVSGPTENRLYRLGRRIVGFSGDYHVATVRDVFDDVLCAGFQTTKMHNWPLPGPVCLYKIAAFQVSANSMESDAHQISRDNRRAA